MAWNTQPRTLEIVSNAIPEIYGKKIFEPVRFAGVSKLGRLSDYQLDVQTIDESGLYLDGLHKVVDTDKLIGQSLTVRIAVEGNGTLADGEINVGAGVREITGVISEMKCLGADNRRMQYRLRLRCFLWLTTLNRDNRHFRDMSVVDISKEILKKYTFKVRWDNVIGAGNGRRPYPKRDYQRQFWQSDWDYLNLLWQEWGLCFYWENDTLVMMDTHGYPAQEPAYKMVRYLERGGQRIDEEHIHKLEYGRGLTTGVVRVMDYDYTMADVNWYSRAVAKPSEATNDNAREYIWADYAQPQQGGDGLNAPRNDEEFEGSHLARVRADAHRNKSLVIKAWGNLRGVMTGRQLTITDHPFYPVNRKYIVTGTKIEIVNNDSVTQGGEVKREYTCRMKFWGVPSLHAYRIPLKAKKPRAFAETAVVTGYDRDPGVLTDPMARVRVKFIWDRRNKRTEEASCWIPLMQVWQGQRYGGLWLPRVGDHVYIGYVNSDPDRPFILGSHVTDYNKVPWDLYQNHALSGWRSQSLEWFGNGSNTVVSDDTPQQLQVQMTSDHANSRFVAGYNVRIDGDKGRTVARGEGIEIASDAHVVGRGNQGMLLTTEPREGASSPVKDMGETVARLTQARQQHEDLSQLAKKHTAQTPESSQADVVQDMKAQNDAIKGGQKTAGNPSPEMTRPDVVIASAAGIATTATDSTHMASKHDHAITVGRDYSLSAGRSMYASVVGSISLFAYRDGMKFFSAQGPVQIQAQGGPMSFKALGDVEVTSSEGRIIINAKDELWLGAGGSFIQINGRGIVNGSPGPILEKGANWKKAEAATMYPRLTAFATHPITFSCDSMAALEQGTATVPPVPMGAAAAPGGSPSSPSAGGGGGTSGVLEQGCTWHQASVVADMRPLNVQSGDYWAVKRNGSPYVIGGQQLFVSYSGYAGRAEFRYDEAGTEIIATVRILILPMDMKESDATGSSVSVPYSADKDQYPNLYPSRQRVPRPVQAISGFLMSAKTKIERVFNDRSHKITTADCPKGNACQCRIPVKFIVEFLTDDPGGIAHATVHLYPKALRADAGSWGEKVTYLDGNNVEHDYPQTQEYVHAHEVGHLFGFPDEYYWDAGAVHKDYIDQSRHLKLTLAQSNPRTDVWQGCTPDTLMGSGVYGNSIPKLPKYYLSQICKWFGEVNQYTWKGA